MFLALDLVPVRVYCAPTEHDSISSGTCVLVLWLGSCACQQVQLPSPAWDTHRLNSHIHQRKQQPSKGVPGVSLLGLFPVSGLNVPVGAVAQSEMVCPSVGIHQQMSQLGSAHLFPTPGSIGRCSITQPGPRLTSCDLMGVWFQSVPAQYQT